MYSHSSLKPSRVQISYLKAIFHRHIATSDANGSSDNSTRPDSADRIIGHPQDGSSLSFDSPSVISSEPVFFRRLVTSLRDLESTIGTSQRSLQSKLRSSMPLLKPSSIKSSNSSQSSHPEKNTLNLIQSMQLKLALSSLESDSPTQFAGLNQTLDKFQQKLLDEEQQLLEDELTDCDNESGDGLLRSFQSVRPKESFLVLLVAHLMNPRLSNCSQSDPMRKHLFMLLNIIQMIRLGSRTRLDIKVNNSEKDNHNSTDSASSMESYRWSILKGNFYYYNVTYSLMRLNMKNVTQLMSGALQDITGIQFWLEKEAALRLLPQERTHLLQMSSAVRQQLATGQLMSVWQSVLSAREASLLGNGCQAVTYLLGKDSHTEYVVSQQLGATLAQILSLLDDFCYLKYECQLPSADSPARWTAVQHFNFLLRLPVLLYLKEACANSRLQLPSTEKECHKLVRNVLNNLEHSNALPKTAALIEHNVTIAEALVTQHFENTPVREAFLAMLTTCLETN